MKSRVRLFALALCACASVAHAQNFPTKPLRVLSTFTPGSVADGLMRLVGQKMADALGQPVVVEAQAGAGGVLAAQTVARAAPDGYTLLHSAPTTLVSTPFILKTQPYDPLKDFTYITHLADAVLSMVAMPSMPFSSVKEMIEFAKANPGKLAYGSNGVGASYHLEMELLKQKYGMDITHVPYKGGQDGLNAAAAGQIPIAFAPAASALAQARGGKVKILALMTQKRYEGMPEVPSLGEQIPDYEKVPTGDEIVGPAGIPAPVVQRLNADIVKVLALAEVKERLKQIGFIGVGNTPEEHVAQIRRDMQVMAKARAAAQIKPE
jgi:tripartite-type tricarboxylate transporter receptor subunit TctC